MQRASDAHRLCGSAWVWCQGVPVVMPGVQGVKHRLQQRAVAPHVQPALRAMMRSLACTCTCACMFAQPCMQRQGVSACFSARVLLQFHM
jgi:hypothetical protein